MNFAPKTVHRTESQGPTNLSSKVELLKPESRPGRMIPHIEVETSLWSGLSVSPLVCLSVIISQKGGEV